MMKVAVKEVITTPLFNERGDELSNRIIAIRFSTDCTPDILVQTQISANFCRLCTTNPCVMAYAKEVFTNEFYRALRNIKEPDFDYAKVVNDNDVKEAISKYLPGFFEHAALGNFFTLDPTSPYYKK